MVLKDIFEQATEHRHSFMSVMSEPQETWKTKLWRYCCVWDCSPKFTKLQVRLRVCACARVCVCVCVLLVSVLSTKTEIKFLSWQLYMTDGILISTPNNWNCFRDNTGEPASDRRSGARIYWLTQSRVDAVNFSFLCPFNFLKYSKTIRLHILL